MNRPTNKQNYLMKNELPPNHIGKKINPDTFAGELNDQNIKKICNSSGPRESA